VLRCHDFGSGREERPRLSHSKQGTFRQCHGQNSCQPTLRKTLVLTLFGVAARIGASIVARLANILDIAAVERLAITNSGPQRTRVSLCYGLLGAGGTQARAEHQAQRQRHECEQADESIEVLNTERIADHAERERWTTGRRSSERVETDRTRGSRSASTRSAIVAYSTDEVPFNATPIAGSSRYAAISGSTSTAARRAGRDLGDSPRCG